MMGHYRTPDNSDIPEWDDNGWLLAELEEGEEDDE